MDQRAHELFTQAAVLAQGAREAFVAENCGDDEELRDEVLAMLAEAERADSLFDWDDAERDEEGTDRFGELLEKEGDIVGTYTLRQKIGEGGFGTVWMAEQKEPIARMVALKVVKAGMDTQQVLTRFEAERQALAIMDHPNIARVIDAGATETGRPYFAMELVKGVPITQFCKEQKYDARRRLELFKDVCSAVNHAHQKGIIHRDLKPSNIMVTLHGDQPVPKVIDFGIAKATQGKLTEQTLFTRFEQFLGTPAYMSPEQTAMSGLDIDTRADIYSLGILLYELLAGAPPFDQKSLLSAGYEEMRRIIREDEPPKPSTRLTETRSEGAGGKLEVTPSRLKGELDWIVMKAIDKDRARRYETANAFASDIERHLNNEPVLAAAPGVGYRFRKFARRNKIALGFWAIMLALLLGGIISTSWQAAKATAEKNRALKAEDLAEQRLDEAEGILDFITGMFIASQPEEGGRGLKVVDVLDDAVKELETIEGLPASRIVRLQDTLGETYHSLGLFEEAVQLRKKVLIYWEAQEGKPHPATLESMAKFSDSCYQSGQVDQAIKVQEELVDLCKGVYGRESERTLFAMNTLTEFFSHSNQYKRWLELQREVFQITQELYGPKEADTLIELNSLANACFEADHKEEAIKWQKESLSRHRDLNGPEDPDTLVSMNTLSVYCYEIGDEDEAVELWKQLVELRRKVSADEQLDTTYAVIQLINHYAKTGQKEKARNLYRELHRTGPKVLRDDAPQEKETLVSPTSKWKWLHPIDGIDPKDYDIDFHETFFKADYNDSEWKIGRDSEGVTGGFGYGQANFIGVHIGSPNEQSSAKCAYFRHKFRTSKDHANLELRCQRDDGIIVYLDGKEVARDNMGASEDVYIVPASTAVDGLLETTTFRIPLEGITLPAGEHILAISLHNAGGGRPSPDLRIGGITLVEVEETNEQ